MLDYSSQFSNALFKLKNIELQVVIASYYNSNLYHEKIHFIKIRTNPNIYSFVFDTLNIFYHIFFIIKIICFKPDIVHFLDNHPWYVFYGELFHLLGCKIYVTQHDPTLHSWEDQTLLWRMAMRVNITLRKLADRIYVHGDKLRQEVISKYSVTQDKVVSIKHGNYNFLKDDFSQWWDIEENTFLFFWRILDYKWLDILLSSLDTVKKKRNNFKLIIAWPWDISQYQEMLERYQDNIEIYNEHIYPEQIYKYFERSEFVVLPYKDATWSWVIPLAYAFSRPVLVTNVWELASVVVDEKTWYVIEKNNTEVLWMKIIEMLEQKSKIRTMWINGRDFSDQELWWDNIVKKIYEK